MIPKELENKILRLHFAEKWPIGTIAKQVGVHHSTVRRVLSQHGVVEARATQRPSIAEPFIPFIVETLERFPSLTASRLYEMVRERGYPGGPDHFRSVVARFRPRKPAEAYLRVRTLPGEQAQVDWGHFGKHQVGGAARPLLAFVMVLSWSRQLFVRFSLDQKMSSFLRGHAEAFDFFGGCPRVLLYDNLKSVVLERRGDAIRFNPTLLDFAAHYRFEPRPAAPYRANEKGRVERAIQYIRKSFFAARRFNDIDDLNAQALAWCTGIAADRRCPEDRTMSVGEAFAEEQSSLLERPDDDFPVDERVEVRVGKTPYVRFDRNDYTVPHDHVRRGLVVSATDKIVRVIDGDEVIATHDRCWDIGKQVEDPDHVAALVGKKRRGRRGRGMDRLAHVAPASRDLLVRAGERGHNLGAATAGLLRLLDSYGAEALQEAIVEALDRDACHVAAVRQVLDRRQQESGKPPPIPVALPDDPRVRDIHVKPHALATYDGLEVTDA